MRIMQATINDAPTIFSKVIVLMAEPNKPKLSINKEIKTWPLITNASLAVDLSM